MIQLKYETSIFQYYQLKPFSLLEVGTLSHLSREFPYYDLTDMFKFIRCHE